MYHDLCDISSWNGMKRAIANFVARCSNCQKVKVQHQGPGGLTQDIDIPTWKWEDVNMDFVVDLHPKRRQDESIWVIMDRFAKSAHFLPVKDSYSAEEYAKLYVKEIVRSHGDPCRLFQIEVPNSLPSFEDLSKVGFFTSEEHSLDVISVVVLIKD